MPLPIDQEIRTRIDQFVAELDTLVRQAAVASVAQALRADGARPRRAARARRADFPRTIKRRKGEKRDPQMLEDLTGQLFAFIKKNAGQRVEQIAKAMGTTTKELTLPAKKLIADKKIRTTGQRRATRYFSR